MAEVRSIQRLPASGHSGLPAPAAFLKARESFVAGTDSPRLLLERCLCALEEWEPKLSAFVTLNVEGARASADASSGRWRNGRPISPIDGMPIGIKDVIETRDMPTGFGSPLFEGWESRKDAASVLALRDAGAVILGKTVTAEFAMSYPGPTRNPWNLAHTPGGSSSGSAAAVAAGMVSASLGTQFIGSIIRPASYCGVFGFKPTLHALSRVGSHDYQSHSCNGVLATSLEDLWQVAYEIGSRSGGDPGWPGFAGPNRLPEPIKPRRLMFLETKGWQAVREDIRAWVRELISRIEASGVQVSSRRCDPAVEEVEQCILNSLELSLAINDFEMRSLILSGAARDELKLSSHLRERLPAIKARTLEEYRRNIAMRSQAQDIYDKLRGTYDAAITLSAAAGAPPGLSSTGDPSFAVPASILGVPCASIPALLVDGLPLGLQVMGFANDDAGLFSSLQWLTTQVL